MRHMTNVSTDGFELKYSMTIVNSTEEEGAQCYGVHVAKYEGGNVIAQQDSGAISYNSQKVEDVIATLARNTVTPMVLCEILDEMDIW